MIRVKYMFLIILISLFIISLIFSFIVFFYLRKDDTFTVELNGNIYRVKYVDRANTLEIIRNNMISISQYCYDNSLPTKTQAENLLYKIKSTIFCETYTGCKYAAYTLNKGEEMRICLEHDDMNDIIFVCIHELAHIMSYSVGHTDEFKLNMELLLKIAVILGIYTPVNYTDNPINFCNNKISNTPCIGNYCNYLNK